MNGADTNSRAFAWRRVAETIRANLTLRVFLPLLAAALATTWYGLWPSLEHFAELTGGLRFVNMQPALTSALLLEQVRGYSPETIRYYLWWIAFDFAWPFLTFTAMLFIAAWLAVLLHRGKLFFGLIFNLGFLVVLAGAIAARLRAAASTR